MNESFYVSLNSYLVGGIHSTNTASNFSTKMFRRLELPDSWEVALVDVTIPMTLHNVRNGLCKAWIMQNGKITKRTTFEDSYLFNVDNIARKIYYELDETFKLVVERGYVKCMQVKEEDVKIRFSTMLAHMLGFPNGVEFINGSFQAQHVHNLNLGLPLMLHVCTDIVKPQINGDSVSQILRTITVNLQSYIFGGVLHACITTPHYIPVAYHEMESIRIDIKDISGKSVSFVYGTSTVKLHFRRRFTRYL